jgi:1A family penicillin-binding protein
MKKFLRKYKYLKNLALLGAGVGMFLIAIIVIWLASIKIPDFRAFEERKVSNSTKIYDRTGEIVLYDIHQDIRRKNITFAEMGENIKNATIAIEDANFYNHKGIRITSIIRAVLFNTFNVGSSTQGGSTITQQLVKNTLLHQKKTIDRKIKEWVLALKIENSLSKEAILEHYLNETPYGGTIYGIEEASRTYFAKNAKDLTVAEAAYLAAIPQAPTTLSPYGKNLDRLENRKNLVLSRMKELNFIDEKTYEQAKNEEVVFQPRSNTSIRAPHFVFYITEYLEQKYGREKLIADGLKVTTTLDYTLQEKAEQIVKEGALQNEKDWKGSNASLVAIDPKTGQILTMVGSRDYFDKNIDGNFNVSTAVRQPGSSFKPFIYATAFDKGFTPDTVLFDVPTEFSTSCDAYGRPTGGRDASVCYMPQNYDGKFRGPMSLRNALAQSINIPAVKLFYLAGLNDSFKTSEDMGITTLTDVRRYGLTLVIGGGEVKLLDITSAYGVFANNGTRNPHTGILKIEDSKGNIIEEYRPNAREVLNKNTALMISDILSDNQARTPTFGANSSLNTGSINAAVKTGTTNNNKDAWTVGYTPTLAVGVWAGNNDNTPMSRGGSAVAGPMWNKFMIEAMKILPNEQFEKPNLNQDIENTKPALRGSWLGNERVLIDRISGKLATENTPKETITEKIITSVHNILHWIDKNNITGEAPSNPQSDPQYRNWEIPVQNWWAQNKHRYQIITPSQIPTEYDDIHTESLKPQITIISPEKEKTYQMDERINLTFANSSYFPLEKIDIFINDTYVKTLKTPFVFSFSPSEINNIRNNNEIKTVVYDSVFNRQEFIASFKVE